MNRARKLLPNPFLTAVLLVCWLWLNNSMAAGHVALGLLLGTAIPLLTTRFWREPLSIRVSRIPAFIAMLLFDIVIANLQVARLILGPIARLRSGFVRVPLSLRTEYAITVFASTISLTPGTVSVEILDTGGEHRALLVHYLSSENPEALVQKVKARYETRVREIFEC